MGIIKKLEDWEKKLDNSIKRDKEKRKNEPSLKEQWKEGMKEAEEREKSKQEARKVKQSTTKKTEKNGFIVLLEALWLLVMSAPIFLIGILALIFGLFLVWELIKSIF
ncbi:hypothetical protein FZC84_12095 [Rossellomorea vietnamensis]|uniref:Uncharacterized protein n=1 Tax=Rossellomorea vietnamensis TaxID=218284 RepID=A0A5D4MAY0_9BACI|nr:hypothetical protein [Rossellomorea vietnamensis]TYR99109.1 hypothetical protein FZC84_12095 [Rossellomorea vietnamensis]